MQNNMQRKYAKYASNMQVLMVLPYIACNMQNMQKNVYDMKICELHFQYAEYALLTLLMFKITLVSPSRPALRAVAIRSGEGAVVPQDPSAPPLTLHTHGQ